MAGLRYFLQTIDFVNEWIGKMSCFFLPAMMVAIVCEVIARYIFNSATTWSFETSQFLFCGMVALGGGYTLLYGGHVNVEIVYERFGKRTRAVIDLITALLFFFFIILFLRESGVMALESVRIREHSESSWGPALCPLKVVIFIGVFLMILQGIAKFIRDLKTALAGEVDGKEAQ